MRREFNVTHRRTLAGVNPHSAGEPPALAPSGEFPRPRLVDSPPPCPEWESRGWDDPEWGDADEREPSPTAEPPSGRLGPERAAARADRTPARGVGMIRSLDELVARVAPSRVSVVITGETGSGKDVLARRIHAVSPRANKPFVSVNCAAFCESLLDSELFGHQKGAFTGAEQSRAGLVEAADGGTLFLDELGELSPPAQAKLLRTIETRFVTRVGSTTPHLVDVRFVAATHRDLESSVQNGRLRADLLYRLDGVRIHLPPLRARPADILPAADSFLDELARREGIPRPILSQAARDLLVAHRWPGNFRELRNVVERAAIICDGGLIATDDLLITAVGLPPGNRRPSVPRGPTACPASPPASPVTSAADAPPAAAPGPASTVATSETPSGGGASMPTTPLPRGVLARRTPVEYERIQSALSLCAGNQTRAAKLLGISRRTLITRLEQHGIPRPRAGRLRTVAASKS